MFLYIYIYIYIYVCVRVWTCHMLFRTDAAGSLVRTTRTYFTAPAQQAQDAQSSLGDLHMFRIFESKGVLQVFESKNVLRVFDQYSIYAYIFIDCLYKLHNSYFVFLYIFYLHIFIFMYLYIYIILLYLYVYIRMFM